MAVDGHYTEDERRALHYRPPSGAESVSLTALGLLWTLYAWPEKEPTLRERAAHVPDLWNAFLELESRGLMP